MRPAWPFGLVALAFAVIAPGAAAEANGGDTSLTRLESPFPAPDFSLTGEDGRTYRLSDYRGQVVVLNFWATWCPPCRYEMPSMERAYRQLRAAGVAILAVNVGEDETTVFAFTGRYPVSFPLPLDRDGSVIARYPVIGLPTTFIIDPRGYVTHRAIGGRAWDDARLLERLRRMRATPTAPR